MYCLVPHPLPASDHQRQPQRHAGQSARPLQLNNIDGLTLTDNIQPMNPAGSPILNCVNCTAVTQSGNVTT